MAGDEKLGESSDGAGDCMKVIDRLVGLWNRLSEAAIREGMQSIPQVPSDQEQLAMRGFLPEPNRNPEQWTRHRADRARSGLN